MDLREIVTEDETVMDLPHDHVLWRTLVLAMLTKLSLSSVVSLNEITKCTVHSAQCTVHALVFLHTEAVHRKKGSLFSDLDHS
jgi:hypothetical protein